MSWIKHRPLNIVLRVQLLITIAVAGVYGIALSGLNGVVSVILGGAVTILPSAVFAIIISNHKGYTADGTIRTALRAEAIKIILTVALLWVVFKSYQDINAIAFIGTFVLTVLAHSVALFVSDSSRR